MNDKPIVLQVKFIEKPKGLRFNSATSRDIKEKGIEYMQVELGRFGLTLLPAVRGDENTKVHKVLFSGEVAQIASAELYDEFDKRGLTNAKVIGEWKGNKYVFDLVPKLLGSEYKSFTSGASKALPNITDRVRVRLSVSPVIKATEEKEEEYVPNDEVFHVEEEVVIEDSAN